MRPQAKTNRAKLPRKTDYDRLNDLIDWYERFAPDGGPKEIPVTLSGEALGRFAHRDADAWHYRGRVLRKLP